MLSLISLVQRFGRLPAPLRGALWMLLSCLMFAVVALLVRRLSRGMHPFEITFFRNLFSLICMLPWLMRAGVAPLRTRRLPMHGVRALSATLAMFALFTAFSLMPLAEVTAISFTAPLFATAGAALFLGETVRPRRWVAVAVGFAGAMIILRPGVAAISFAALMAVVAAVTMATSALLVKSLSRTDSAITIVLYMALLTTPMSLLPALAVWTTPAPETWAWLVLLGGAATVTQIALTSAYAAADVTAVIPFDFSKLIFTALIGFLAFGERPEVWTWVGAGVIFVATLYTARREAAAARASDAGAGGPAGAGAP